MEVFIIIRLVATIRIIWAKHCTFGFFSRSEICHATIDRVTLRRIGFHLNRKAVKDLKVQELWVPPIDTAGHGTVYI